MAGSELARRLGISRQRMWMWETQGVPLGHEQLVILAMKELQRTLEHEKVTF